MKCIHHLWYLVYIYHSVTYLILRRMLGYTNDQQIDHYCHLMTLGIQVHLPISWHVYVQ